MPAISPWQAAQQLRHLLETATWSDSPNDLIFGANGHVQIYGRLPIQSDATPLGHAPIALIGVGDAEPDTDDPDIFEHRFKLALAVTVVGDPYGSGAIIGANWSIAGDTWQGEGRGLLQFEEEALGAIGRLTGANGVPIACSLRSGAEPVPIGDGLHVMAREYDLSMWCTRQRGYDNPYDLAATNNGDGTVTLTWKIPPGDRYDYRDLVLRHASGSTAPASVTAGTDVDLDDPSVAKALLTVNHTPGSDGAHSYAIFAGFTDTGAASNERYSDQKAGTTATVTVSGT